MFPLIKGFLLEERKRERETLFFIICALDTLYVLVFMVILGADQGLSFQRQLSEV